MHIQCLNTHHLSQTFNPDAHMGVRGIPCTLARSLWLVGRQRRDAMFSNTQLGCTGSRRRQAPQCCLVSRDLPIRRREEILWPSPFAALGWEKGSLLRFSAPGRSAAACTARCRL